MAIQTRKDEKGREYQFDTDLQGPVIMLQGKDGQEHVTAEHLVTEDEVRAKEEAKAERDAKKEAREKEKAKEVAIV